MAPRRTRDPVERMLAFALGFPGAWEDHPWGETVAKVGKKVFVFMGSGDAGPHGEVALSICTKLPESAEGALAADLNTEPAGYGLGKSGWVVVRFAPGDPIPFDLLEDWVDESYRAVATKTLVKQLDALRGGPTAASPG